MKPSTPAVKAENPQTIQSAGAAIRVFLYGQTGPFLVLLHGNGEDHTIFASQIAYFQAYFRVVAIDSRCHGASSFALPLSIGQMAQDVLAVMDALNIQTAAVLGYSDGGNIALKLAAMAPGRLWALVVSGANLSTKGVKRRVQVPIVLGWALCAAMGVFSQNARKQAHVLRLMVKEPQISPQSLRAIGCPTLVMAGERDIIRPAHTRLIAQSIAGASQYTVKNAGHDVFNQAPGEVNRQVHAFLKEHAPS